MIKKLIISAAVLTALISGKEASAAGAGGFARALSSVSAVQVQVADNRALQHDENAERRLPGLRVELGEELLRVNSAVNSTMADLDSYFDDFAGGFTLEQGCFDCADLKRKHLISLGWSEKVLRITYAMGADGRIERALLVSTDRGNVVLGSGSPVIDLSEVVREMPVAERPAQQVPAYLDI